MNMRKAVAIQLLIFFFFVLLLSLILRRPGGCEDIGGSRLHATAPERSTAIRYRVRVVRRTSQGSTVAGAL